MAAITEHWNPHVKIRQDLFGIFDVVVLSPEYESVIFLQVTSGGNHAARREKLISSEVFKFLRSNDVDCATGVQSWRKNSKGRWVTRIEMWDKSTFDYAPMEVTV